MHPARFSAALVASLITLAAGAEEPLPSIAELERRGALIGEIRIDARNIFDLEDPRESGLFYRLANALHITTRPWLIQRLLLFSSGEPVSQRLVEETERLIRSTSTVYDVTIRPIRYAAGVVDLEVTTRDTWTLQPGATVRHTGGKSSGSLSLEETNLFGTGTTFGFERRASVDRTGSLVRLGHQHLFDGWTTLALERAAFDDGSSALFNLDRPFYALDTRRAGGVRLSSFDRRDPLYQSGVQVGDYRHQQQAGEVYGGWSRGLVDRWTHRFSVGLTYQDDRYAIDPARPAPAAPPAERTLAGPLLRYEALEDDFLPIMNRERIQRPEYFRMGWHSLVQVGRGMAALGSTEEPWQIKAELTKGFRVPGGREILTALRWNAQYGSAADVRTLGMDARYFVPQGTHTLLYLAGRFDTVKSPNAGDELLLGGDNGLRGYPLRYQRGRHRALFTAEERYYTEWYPLRLFRVGFAAYVDVGRAWETQLANEAPGWLANVGFGFRALSTRASFGNVLHIDLALPLHRSEPGLPRRQFLIMTAKSF